MRWRQRGVDSLICYEEGRGGRWGGRWHRQPTAAQNNPSPVKITPKKKQNNPRHEQVLSVVPLPLNNSTSLPKRFARIVCGLGPKVLATEM